MNKLVPFGVALATAAFISFASHAAVTTVESGQTLTVTDATVGDYADGFQFADETGVIEFNTTAAPTMDITGAGTVKKTSDSSSWTMSKQLPNFSGEYILQGGGVVTATGDENGSGRYLFGNDTGALTILDGNTLYAPNTGKMPMFYTKLVKVEGTGVNGRGAIHTLLGYNGSADFIRNVKLLDDALLQFEGDYYLFLSGANFDMDGHELTFYGKVALDTTGSNTFSTKGTIRLLSNDTSGPWFKIRSRWMGFSETEDPFVIDNYGGIAFYYDGAALHDVYAIKRPLVNKGKNGYIGVLQQNQTSPCTYTNQKANVWASKVTLEPDSVLDMRSALLRQQFNLTGEVTGEGSVTVGGTSKDARKNLGRIYFANTNNTYKGFTFVNNSYAGANYGQFLAAGPHSIPNYSSLTGSYGMVSLRMKARESDDEELWTDGTFIRDLANEGTWLNNCGIGFDTASCGGVLTLNYPAGITNATATIGGTGPNDIVLTNVVGTVEHPFRLHQMGGKMTVKTKPGEPQYLGDVRVSAPLWNPFGVTDSTICFEDSDLIVPEDGKLSVACMWPTYDAKTAAFDFAGTNAVLQLKNTRLVTARQTNEWADVASDILIVGSADGTSAKRVGTLEVYDDSVVTGRLSVGGTVWGGLGAVYQYGGSVTALGGSSTDWYWTSQVGAGKTSSGNGGYYELRGGEFVAAGRFAIGEMQTGFFAQYGGSFRMTNALNSTSRPALGINVNNGGQLASGLYVAGGTFDLGSADITMNGRWSGAEFHSFLAVEGADTFVNFGTRSFSPNAVAAGHTDVTLANGGRFRTAGIRKGVGDSELVLNFNGGIWECSWSRSGYAGCDDIFHIERNSFPGTGADVFVYDGGMTVDTAGMGGLSTYRPITGASGGGITGLSGFEPFHLGMQPIVRISGDGRGAVAVAEWNRETGMVTGIKVLAPGVGYKTATAKFCYAMYVEHETPCTIAENANTGSFTKAGAAEFLLAATNTWGGATVVKGGSLKANCDWAIPTNTAVRLEGGNLDLNGKVAKISSVTYGAGGGQILNAENAELPATASIVVDIADLVAGNPVALTGDVDLSTTPITITGDVSLLKEGAKYVLATTTDGIFIGKPTYTLEDEPANWGLANRGTKLVYRFVKGALILVR